uniref:Uncharacterized protein n=1 Tax=Meloidogyne hapla TaxID=6305 RepID=A0A1I8AXP9_MELHA
MFINVAALSLAFLVLLGQFNTIGADNVGLGNHVLQGGKVTLAAGSRVANKEDIEKYRTSFPDACEVVIDEQGNIILHYTNQGATKDKGCTVDLLTDKVDEIAFLTGLFNPEGLAACLKGSSINANILPFAYSLTNEEIKQFHNGPRFVNEGCDESCEEGCIEKTGLEVRLLHGQTKNGEEFVVFFANPIGTKLIYSTGLELDKKAPKNEVKQMYLDVEINQTDPKFHFKESREEQETSTCMKNIKENILSPSTWEIDGTSPDPTMNRLLVFHLLPQKASRKRRRDFKNPANGVMENAVKKELPEGPKCYDLMIVFLNQNYKLLTTLPSSNIPPTPKQPIGASQPQGESKDPIDKETFSTTSTSNDDNSTVSTTKGDSENATTISQTTEINEVSKTTSPKDPPASTTSITKATTTTTVTTTTKSSSGIVVVVIVVVILAIVGIGAAVYFFVIKKGSDKEEKDAEGGDETKGDAEGADEKKEGAEGEEKEKEDGEEGDKSKDDEEGDKSKGDDEEGDKKDVKDSASKTEGETKEEQTGATSVDTEDKKEEEEEGEKGEAETPEDEANKKVDEEVYKV